jgi:hypothetical protein
VVTSLIDKCWQLQNSPMPKTDNDIVVINANFIRIGRIIRSIEETTFIAKAFEL